MNQKTVFKWKWICFILLEFAVTYVGSLDALESAFARCCTLGVNWGREQKSCSTFPSPVPGEASEHQEICKATVPLCCLRFYRDEECNKGKLSAQNGQDCRKPNTEGGEFFKDCCDGCKLGMMSSALGKSCTFRSFNFGFPWDNAFYSCCAQASNNDVNQRPTSPQGPYRPNDPNNGQLYPNNGPIIPDSENLCVKFPGQLCGQVCIPTPGSYRCACRAGFTLSLDGKTCVQEHVNDRCKLNNPCDHICRDTGMAIECSCNSGYSLSLDQRSCKDIDECNIGSHHCLPDQVCYNQKGTYACINGDGSLTSPGWRPGTDHILGNRIPNDRFPGSRGDSGDNGRCPLGYKFNLQSRVCDDIDECLVVDGLCWGGPSTCQNTIGSYTCTPLPRADCPPGYQFVLDHQSCLDIDECATNQHDCDHKLELCVNTLGGFTCQTKQTPTDCPAGYKYNTTVQACQDVDECLDDNHLCNTATETCVNEVGGYSCQLESNFNNSKLAYVTTTTTTTTTVDSINTVDLSTTEQNIDEDILLSKKPPKCPDGYIYDSLFKSCRDIDECITTSPCESLERCVNTLGSFECLCKDGFREHSIDGHCIDVNECVLGLHTCTRSQRCDNTAGSYICVRTTGCGTGYTLNHGTGKCEDNDECELGTDDCRQLGPQWACVNTKGSHRCNKKQCPDQQLLAPNGTCVDIKCQTGFVAHKRNCIDIDECQEVPGPCLRNEICLNIEGSYRCRARLNCGPGFKMNEPGTACIDVDECLENSHQCAEGQDCVNRPGDYICQCPSGYRLNTQRKCEDINECQFYYGGVCPGNSVCENTPGSYSCNCKEGYRKSAKGRICIDIDECREITGICHHGCINVGGSYFCKCNAGFILGNDNRTCTDIDECEEYKGRGRLCLGLCVNTAGSFNCECPPGYTLASDSRTCTDINECETGSPCTGTDEMCVNTRGGHKCNKISCPHNYILDPQHKNRCKRVSLYCREGDLECLKEPLSYAYNFYSLAKDLNLPPNGQADLFTMRGPPWSSRTIDFVLELESTRAPAGVKPATRQSFLLKRTNFNQAVISLLESLEGPQEVQLVLKMKLYHNSIYRGSSLAKLLIYVSEYDF